jgi:pyruvate dehydrogenase E1 component beta subunit
MIIHNKGLLGMTGEVPEGEYLIPIGKANVVREGSDVTLVSYSRMVHECLGAAEDLAKEGVSAEVIDLRSLVPLDKEAIFASLEKTGRLVIVHEAVGKSGFGAEVAAVVAEEALDLLDAPIRRVTALFSPVPYSAALESAYFPDKSKVISAVKSLVRS